MKLERSWSFPQNFRSPNSLAWSRSGTLALVTHRGISCLSIYPNPNATNSELNISETFIASPTVENPYFEQIDIDVDLLMQKVDPLNHNIILDIFMKQGLSEGDNQFESVWWSRRLEDDHEDSLALALTSDFWMKIYKYSKGTWVEATDVSKALHHFLRSNDWKHCISAQETYSPQDKIHKMLEPLQRRSEALSVVQMCWLTGTSFFVTASRSGLVILWEFAKEQANVSQILATEVQDPLRLICHRLSERLHLALLGGANGMLKAVKVEVSLKVTGLDLLGSIWNEPDFSPVTEIAVFKDCFSSKRRVEILFSKDSMLLHSKVSIDGKYELSHSKELDYQTKFL